MFDIQEELLDVGGQLTCLWADMINPVVEADKEQIALLIQRALVLLGSASHSISLERRKIARARINPSLKSLATEEYKHRKDKLFGLGFSEKASKKLETDKALAKVTAPPHKSRKRSHPDDPSDLHFFLSKSTPNKYGSKGSQHQSKLYNQCQLKPYNPCPHPKHNRGKANYWTKKHRQN